MADDKESYEKIGKIVAIFLATVSLLTVYSNTVGGGFSGKAGGQATEATRHMLNATDWWSYYQAHKLRITVYTAAFMQAYSSNDRDFNDASAKGLFSKLDNYDQLVTGVPKENWSNVRTNFISNISTSAATGSTRTQLMNEYMSAIEKSIQKANDGSNYATHEEQEFSRLMELSAKNSAYGSKYSFVTTMLIVAVTLGGIANITKRRFLAYVCFVIGAFAIINLALLVFAPGILGLPLPPP